MPPERARRIRTAVVTVSSSRSRGEAVDESGPALAAAIAGAGDGDGDGGVFEVVARELVDDDAGQIRSLLTELADERGCDLILTTGGTGCAPDDGTPEATARVIERPLPGIAEALRAASIGRTPHGMLSRGIAGIRGRTIIVNLPGSVRACEDGVAVIAPALPHAVALVRGETHGH